MGVQVTLTSKICSRCDKEKPLDRFIKDSKYNLGVTPHCKDCFNKSSKERRESRNLVEKICPSCGSVFSAKEKNQKYCCKECSWTALKKERSPIQKFFLTTMTKERRDSGLTPEILEDLFYKQKGKCALSGTPMTYTLGSGRLSTNASIDRVEAGLSYSLDNIQLVCSAVNSFRNKKSIEEFIWWCDRVSEYNKGVS